MADPTAAPSPQHPAVGTATQPPTASPSTGTALATVEDEGVGKFPPAIQQALRMRKLANAVASEITKLSWGQNIDRSVAMAIGEWGHQHGVDVITEIDFLGNKPYLNSRFYFRKLAEQIARDRVEYAVADFVHVDRRLDKLAAEGDAEAVEEQLRRAKERIKRGIPDEATGACVFRIKLRSMNREIVGVNWCGGGTGKHKAGGKGDPVGEVEPIKTAESRAGRRGIRLMASHMPEEAKVIEATVQSLDAFQPIMERAQKQLAADSAPRRTPAVHGGGYAAPAPPRPAGSVPVEVIDQGQHSRARGPARDLGPDPYLATPPTPEPPPEEQSDLDLDRELLERDK